MNQYTKTVWMNGTSPAISAENLNKIEEAIKAVTDEAIALGTSVGGKLSTLNIQLNGSVDYPNADTAVENNVIYRAFGGGQGSPIGWLLFCGAKNYVNVPVAQVLFHINGTICLRTGTANAGTVTWNSASWDSTSQDHLSTWIKLVTDSRTIAGIDLKDDITASELAQALSEALCLSGKMNLANSVIPLSGDQPDYTDLNFSGMASSQIFKTTDGRVWIKTGAGQARQLDNETYNTYINGGGYAWAARSITVHDDKGILNAANNSIISPAISVGNYKEIVFIGDTELHNLPCKVFVSQFSEEPVLTQTGELNGFICRSVLYNDDSTGYRTVTLNSGCKYIVLAYAHASNVSGNAMATTDAKGHFKAVMRKWVYPLETANATEVVDAKLANHCIKTRLNGEDYTWDNKGLNTSTGEIGSTFTANVLTSQYIPVGDNSEVVYTGSAVLHEADCTVYVYQYVDNAGNTSSYLGRELLYNKESGRRTVKLDGDCQYIRFYYYHTAALGIDMPSGSEKNFSAVMFYFNDLLRIEKNTDHAAAEIIGIKSSMSESFQTLLVDGRDSTWTNQTVDGSGNFGNRSNSILSGFIDVGDYKEVVFTGTTVLHNLNCIVYLVQYSGNSVDRFISGSRSLLYSAATGVRNTVVLNKACRFVRFTYAHASGDQNNRMRKSDAIGNFSVILRKWEENKTPSEIFNIDLSNADEYGSIVGYSQGNISTGGYSNPEGWSNRVRINKYIVCDDVTYRANIHLGSDGTGVCALATETADFTTSNHATIVKFDFENALVSFLTGANGNGSNIDGKSIPGYTYDSFQLQNLSGTDYRIEIGRINRCPYAKVYNLTSGALCGEKVLTVYETDSSYGAKAGALYDFPTFGVLSGTISFKRVSASVPTDRFCLFIGDSITEGSQLAIGDVWANKVIDYLGSGLNCGRGGGDINHVMRCVSDILPAVKPKYVVVTIGTNETPTAAQLETLIRNIRNQNAIPIINCIPMNNRGNTASVAEIVLSLGVDSCRFDLATAINNDVLQGENTELFHSDLVHPNAAGGVALYNRFLADVGWIKQ